MIDIDLIPAEYRARQSHKRWLTLLLAASGTLIVAAVGSYFALSYLTKEVRSDVEELLTHQAITKQQRAELEELSAYKTELQQQLALLNGLRSGAAAETMFVTIDRALVDEELWFLRWQFQRAGVIVGEEEKGVETGYFIVVPRGKSGADKERARPWQVETHMSIKGQASDHSTLSKFVRRLFQQPEIADVRLHKTSLRHYSTAQVVDFDLDIVLNSDVQG